MPTPAQFATRKAAVENALNSFGTSERVIQDDIDKTMARLGAFIDHLTKRTVSQAIYNHLTNIPTGIAPHDPLHVGIVSAISQMVGFDPTEALRIAGDIAEDVNAHSEAAKIREMMYQPA